MTPNERDNNYQLNYTVLSRLYHHAMLGYDKKFRPNFMGMGYCFKYKNCYDFFFYLEETNIFMFHLCRTKIQITIKQ